MVVRLQRILGLGVGEHVIVIAQLIKNALDPPYHEYRLTAPHHFQHLSGLELGGIHLDRAPSALARALGFHEARKGTAANATPMAPVPTVAAVNSRRGLWSTCSLIRLSLGIVDKSSRKPL